jgi:hypothetical protein
LLHKCSHNPPVLAKYNLIPPTNISYPKLTLLLYTLQHSTIIPFLSPPKYLGLDRSHIYKAAITAPKITNNDPPTFNSTAAFPVVVGTLDVLALVLLELLVLPLVPVALVAVVFAVALLPVVALPVMEPAVAEPVDDEAEVVADWVEAETVLGELRVNCPE